MAIYVRRVKTTLHYRDEKPQVFTLRRLTYPKVTGEQLVKVEYPYSKPKNEPEIENGRMTMIAFDHICDNLWDFVLEALTFSSEKPSLL